MSHLVAQVLDAADFLDLGVDVAVVGEQIDQRAGGVDEIVRHRRKHVEKTGIPGNDSEHWVAANSTTGLSVAGAVLRSEPISHALRNPVKSEGRRWAEDRRWRRSAGCSEQEKAKSVQLFRGGRASGLERRGRPRPTSTITASTAPVPTATGRR